jgi:hypothetical protein
MNWLVFSYSLPTKSSSSPRVALWRRLRRLGAVSPAGGVQVLPARDECREAFQWLAQEIRQAGGEALVMRVEQFEGLTDQHLIDLFHAARAEEYAELGTRAEELEKVISKRTKSDDRTHLREEMGKLRRRHAEITRVDYFNSPAQSRVAARLAAIEQSLVPDTSPQPKIEPAVTRDYQGKRWITRPRPHVDRLACAWLIRRFVDPKAVIRYAASPKSNEIAFDMDEGQFGHRGNLCTFETMRLAFGFDDAGLRAIAEIVHAIDLRDGRYTRPEIAGIDAILTGWSQSNMSDAELEAQGITLFDGVYASLLPARAGAARKKKGLARLP